MIFFCSWPYSVKKQLSFNPWCYLTSLRCGSSTKTSHGLHYLPLFPTFLPEPDPDNAGAEAVPHIRPVLLHGGPSLLPGILSPFLTHTSVLHQVVRDTVSCREPNPSSANQDKHLFHMMPEQPVLAHRAAPACEAEKKDLRWPHSRLRELQKTGL